MNTELKRGTQIIYTPDHVNDNINHPDCERGFVITDKGNSASCRYFNHKYRYKLRTVANSESTNKRNLVVRDTIEQSHVDKFIKQIKAKPEIYGEIN